MGRCLQALVAQGEYHPSSNSSMMTRLGIPYLPSQYPPPQLRAQGFVCNCDQFYSDPCRSEFRAVRTRRRSALIDACLHANVPYGRCCPAEAGSEHGRAERVCAGLPHLVQPSAAGGRLWNTRRSGIPSIPYFPRAPIVLPCAALP